MSETPIGGEPGCGAGWRYALTGPPRWIVRPRLLGVAVVAIGAGLVLIDGPSIGFGTCLWAGGLLALGVACWGPAAPSQQVQPVPTRAEIVGLGCLLAVGLLLRVWSPEMAPSGVHVDEAAMALVALEVLQGRGPHPFGFGFIGDPAPFMYVEAAFMALLGPSVGAVRLLAGLSGALTLFALWLLARPLFGPRVALLAVGLLMAAAAHLHFSRMALNVVQIALFGYLGLALVWRGALEGRPAWHLLGGMALGFGQYANFGARAFVLSAAGTYAALILAQPRSWRALVGGGCAATLGALAALAPQLVYVRDDPRQLWDRLQFRSVFRRWDQATEIHGTTDPVWVMLGQAKVSLLAFVNYPDRGPFYEFAGEPLLAAPGAALFLLGLALAVSRARDPRYASVLLACGGVLLGSALSAGVPQFHRLVTMLPAACLLAAVAADELARWLDRVAKGLGSARAGSASRLAAGRPSTLALSALVGIVAVEGFLSVFVRQPALLPWQPQTDWARWLSTQEAGRKILLAGAPNVFTWDERVRLLGGAADLRDVANPTVELPAALDEGNGFVLALNPRLSDWLPVVHHLLAEAVAHPVADPRGDPLLLAFDVAGPRSTVGASDGLRGELVLEERDRSIRFERHDASLVFRESSRLTEGRPFAARWTGRLLVDTPGEYRLELYTDGGVELLLNGKPIVQGRPSPEPRSLRTDLHLDAGEHPIEVHYSYTRGLGTLELRWRPPGNERSLIPPKALRPG